MIMLRRSSRLTPFSAGTQARNRGDAPYDEESEVLGRRLSLSVHPTLGYFFPRVLSTSRRLVREAEVCGSHGRKVARRDAAGRFPRRPPGSMSASPASASAARERYSEDQHSSSSAQSS